jgi:hypothetical protein
MSISNNLGKHQYEPPKCASNFKKRILGKIKKSHWDAIYMMNYRIQYKKSNAPLGSLDCVEYNIRRAMLL